MYRQKSLFCGAVAALFLTAPAFANGAGTWNGFYAGVHGGYAWGEWNGPLHYDDAHLFPSLDFDDSKRTIDGDGWLVGLQLGYNHQFGSWVVGAEADLSWTGFDGSGAFLPYPDNPGSPAWHIQTDVDLMSTARLRAGHLVTDSWLLYATAGGAWAQAEGSIRPVYSTGSFAHGETEVDHFGWTAGVGAEWKLTERVSLKTEWLYADFGEEDYAFVGTTLAGATYDTDHIHASLDFHTVRVGVTYLFN